MNPKNHPNAYVGLSAGSVAAFLVYEANKHGLSLDPQEAGFAVSAIVAALLFAGRKLGGKSK